MTGEEFHIIETFAREHDNSLIKHRCLAILLLNQGMSQIDVAEELGVVRQTIYRWHKIYTVHGIQEFCTLKPRGRPPILPLEKVDAIKETLLETQKIASPLVGHEMKEVLLKEGYDVSLATLYNILHGLELSCQVPRPVHPKRDENRVKEWLKDFPEVINSVSKGQHDKKIEIYFGDETRYGQQGILRRQWSEVGKRPWRIRQIDYKNGWIYGAANVETGEHYGLVTSHVGGDFMQEFLDILSSGLSNDSHALLILDNASWHKSHSLQVPKNITLHYLPPYSPDLNPVERLWGYMKRNYLCNRVYDGVEEIMERGAWAWRQISDEIVASICKCEFLPNFRLHNF